MSKLVSLIAVTSLLVASAAFAGEAAEHMDDRSDEAGKIDKTGKTESSRLKEALDRLGKPANDNAAGLRPGEMRGADGKVTMKVIKGGKAESAKDAKIDASVAKDVQQASSDETVAPKTSAKVGVADSAANNTLTVLGTNAAKAATIGEGNIRLATMLSERVASGELSAETASGLVEANAASVKVIGRPIINPKLAKDCAGMDSEALDHLSGMYGFLSKEAANGNHLSDEQVAQKLVDETARVFNESRKAAAERDALVGGKDVNGREGAQCLLMDAKIATECQAIAIAN